MSVRLINLGLPKSGTTTLAHALRHLGWRVADHKLRDQDGALISPDRPFVAQRIYDAYFSNTPPLSGLTNYDALSEINMLNGNSSLWPQSDYPVLKALRLSDPTLRFVATWRPAAQIADSMMRWNNLGSHRLPQGTLPGLPHGYGRSEAELKIWIEGHYTMLQDVFGEDPRFLLLDVASPTAQHDLGAFIGCALPWWGQENINPRARAE
jgi:hypothetical protein